MTAISLRNSSFPRPGRQAKQLGNAGALTSLIILIPIGTIGAYLFAPPSENWAHLVETVLPEYVRNSLWLMAGVSVAPAVSA